MGFSAREVVRILLWHYGGNRCEIVICYLGAWEEKKITSVKTDHTFSVRVSTSLCGGGVVSTTTVCTGWGPTYFWHPSCKMSWSQKWSHWSFYNSILIYTDLSFISLLLGCHRQSLVSVTCSKQAHFLTWAFPHSSLEALLFFFFFPLKMHCFLPIALLHSFNFKKQSRLCPT